MKRICVHLTEHELAALHAIAAKAGLKFAEVLRRIIDKGVDEWRQRQREERDDA
jgi:predicted DNA binding CopG/RHH family protein